MLLLNKYFKIEVLLLIASLFLFKNITSQNLIRNGSFESYNIPPNWNNWSGNFFDATVNPIQRIMLEWDELGSADLLATACTHSYASVPVNRFGYSQAKEGSNYVGFAPFQSGNNSKEYIYQQLTSPLQSGKTYCLNFFILRADRMSYAVHSIGAYFTNNAQSTIATGYINAIPQVLNQNGFIIDTTQWAQIQGCFIANGGEQYITIGNFNSNSNTDTLIVGTNNPMYGIPNPNFAYYYIDDITLIDQTTVGINELDKEISFEVYPNPNNGTMQFNYSITKKSELIISDITGRIVNNYILDETKKSILIKEELNTGIYFYSISQNNIVLKQDKIIITK